MCLQQNEFYFGKSSAEVSRRNSEKSIAEVFRYELLSEYFNISRVEFSFFTKFP